MTNQKNSSEIHKIAEPTQAPLEFLQRVFEMLKEAELEKSPFLFCSSWVSFIKILSFQFGTSLKLKKKFEEL